MPVTLNKMSDKCDLADFLSSERGVCGRGFEDSKHVAAITKAVFMLHYNKWWVPTDSRSVKRMIALFDDFRDSILWAAAEFPKRTAPMGAIGALAYAHAVPGLAEKVEDFSTKLRSDSTTGTASVVELLKRAFGQWRGCYAQTHRVAQQRAALDAIRLYCLNLRARRLKTTLEGVNWIRKLRGESPIA